MVQSPFLTERNKSIYLDRVANYMYFKDIAKKYGISTVRARQIYVKYQRFIDKGKVKL